MLQMAADGTINGNECLSIVTGFMEHVDRNKDGEMDFEEYFDFIQGQWRALAAKLMYGRHHRPVAHPYGLL